MIKWDVVLISGKQGSGKTSVSKEIKELITSSNLHPQWSFVELVFASEIYLMHDFCRNTLFQWGIPAIETVKDGDLLQYLGTEWGRKKFGEDVWVNILRKKVKKYVEWPPMGVKRVTFVVPDCRFKNELNSFSGESLNVRLECPRDIRKSRCGSGWRENDYHPSEIDLDGMQDHFDLIFSTGSISAKEIAKDIFKALLQR